MSDDVELDLLRSSVTQIFGRADDESRHAANELDEQAWAGFDESGLLRVGIPVSRGGEGGTHVDLSVVLSGIGYHAGRVPVAENWLATWLQGVLDMDVLPGRSSLYLPEVGLGEVPLFGDDHVIGPCHSVPWGSDADSLVVIGSDREGQSMAGVFGAAELQFNPGHNVAGEPRVDTVLTHIPIDNARSISDDVLQELRLRAAFTHSCLMSGAMSRVVELSVSYALDREQFGRPIGRFQAVQRLVAIVAEEAAAAKAITVGAAERLDGGDSLACAAAKVRVGQGAARCAAASHQVHGAIGFTDEHSLKNYTTRLWAWRDEYGDEMTWSKYLGERLMESDGSFWEAVTQRL
jgi:acyl-CoA dehydrogenase